MAANLYNHRGSNIVKTWLMMFFFIALVVGLGYLLAFYFNEPLLLYFALGFSILMNIFSYWKSDKVALSQARAVPADPGQYKNLHNLVENLAITAGLPKPGLYIINDPSPNAFAAGRNPKHSVIAVTTGLLDVLDTNELQGVIAHEMAHIGNRDILVMSVAVVLAGFVALASEWVLRGFGFSSFSEDRNSGAAAIVIVIIASIIASLFATLLKLAVSRRREYLADATGALLTRYPEGLASALEKISANPRPLQTASKATAHLYISEPFRVKKSLNSLFATHPPIEKRVAALRGIDL